MKNKIKIATNLEQSQKLAEILPLESADMHFINDKHAGCVPYLEITNSSNPWLKGTNISPCWSLAVLIDILPNIITDKDGTIFGLNIKKNFIEYYNPSMGALYATYHSIIAEDLVDACYEMIIKLHEQKLL